MAATCPKCGGKLRLIDWKPNCPHCGVNMVYYGMEERLLLDADKAEAEHARTQPKVDRIKAATVGSPLAIARLVLSLIPIAGLFLPLAKFAFTAPYAAFSGNVNAISLYNVVSTTDMDALMSMFGSKLFGTAFILYGVAIVCVALSALGVLFHTIFQTLACSPKGKQRNIAFDVLNLLLVGGAIICFTMFSGRITALFPHVVQTSAVGFGAFVYLGLILLSFAMDILCIVKGVPIKYKECFVGNIPADKYFQLVEEGVPLEQIRQVMAEHTAQKEAEKKAQEEAEAAAKAAEAGKKEKETAKVQ
ncbi:MAG: hypothetical protein IJT41_01375 [Clostridia bacterium]|nr:hypothetical protein [Clostridia bacterium]